MYKWIEKDVIVCTTMRAKLQVWYEKAKWANFQKGKENDIEWPREASYEWKWCKRAKKCHLFNGIVLGVTLDIRRLFGCMSSIPKTTQDVVIQRILMGAMGKYPRRG